MTGNRSTAVMQRREPTSDDRFGPRGFRTALDYFPTPPWAVRAACEFLRSELGQQMGLQTVWEPACGEMHMVRGLTDYFARVIASDIFRYSPDHHLHDFLTLTDDFGPVDWIFTNPPFIHAEAFIRRAIARAAAGVVMFVRGSFTESDERYQTLFSADRRPAYVVTYVERVVLLRDRVIRSGAPDPFNLREGKPVKASSATSYSLVIWMPGQHDTRHRWIPKCRLQMERPGDYPSYTDQWESIRAGTELFGGAQ